MGRSKKKSDPLAIYKDYEIFENTNRKTDNCPVVFFRTYLFQCKCKGKNNHWESACKDSKDGEKCYDCRHLVKPYEEIIGSTPYQGERRVYGTFRCHKCLRSWESAFSWSNTSQKCEVCNLDVFPHDQDNLKFSGIKNFDKGHQQALCGMCRKLNKNCKDVLVNPDITPGQPLRKNRSRRKRLSAKNNNLQIMNTGSPINNAMQNKSVLNDSVEAKNGHPRNRRRRHKVQQINETEVTNAMNNIKLSG